MPSKNNLSSELETGFGLITRIASSITLGLGIWGAFALTDYKSEAWDKMSYYLPAVFSAGFVAAVLIGRRFILASVYILLGQMLYYMIFVPQDQFGPLGILILLTTWPLSLLGSFIGYKMTF